jgi:hypothetical protein
MIDRTTRDVERAMPETTESPYRTPRTAIVAPDERIVYEATGTFSIARCVKDAWASLLRNFLPFLGLAGLLFLVSFGLSFLARIVGSISQGAMLLAFGLVYLVSVPVLLWGMVRFSLNAIDGRARVSDVLAIFDSLGSRLGKVLLLWLILLALSLPGSLPMFAVALSGGSGGLFWAAWLCSIVWSLAVSLRFLFSFYFMVDGEMSATDALRSSWDRTRGNTLRLIGLFLVGFGIYLAGLLLLVVGVIPAAMLIIQLYPSAFRQIVGRLEPARAARAV